MRMLSSKILALTGGKGVDKAVDCSGVVAAHRLCIDSTRRRGAVAFVGESGADTPLRISPDMIRKGLSWLVRGITISRIRLKLWI